MTGPERSAVPEATVSKPQLHVTITAENPRRVFSMKLDGLPGSEEIRLDQHARQEEFRTALADFLLRCQKKIERGKRPEMPYTDTLKCGREIRSLRKMIFERKTPYLWKLLGINKKNNAMHPVHQDLGATRSAFTEYPLQVLFRSDGENLGIREEYLRDPPLVIKTLPPRDSAGGHRESKPSTASLGSVFDYNTQMDAIAQLRAEVVQRHRDGSPVMNADFIVFSAFNLRPVIYELLMGGATIRLVIPDPESVKKPWASGMIRSVYECDILVYAANAEISKDADLAVYHPPPDWQPSQERFHLHGLCTLTSRGGTRKDLSGKSGFWSHSLRTTIAMEGTEEYTKTLTDEIEPELQSLINGPPVSSLKSVRQDMIKQP